MSVPRIVVNETLEIKRIAVSAEGQDITVTIAEAAAGVSTVNGQSDVVVLSTDDITEGVDNLYYTQARADARVAAGIAAIDFPVDSVNGQTGAVVLSSSNIAEGTNLYYTQDRADARVAAGIAAIDYPVDSVNGKTNTVVLTTSDIGEGTNLYHTTARARSAISASGSLTYNSSTGVIDYTTPTTIASLSNHDTDDLAEGTTNKYYTDARADARVAVGIANLVDSAPTTLDTLNELAAALGDDPNFATTVTTALGNKLNTADFTSTADTWLGTKSTTNLGEGTNLYYTTARANSDFDTRLATKTTSDLGEGTNKYYTDARVRTAVANGVDLAVNGSNEIYVKSLRHNTRLLGEMQATTNNNYVFPPQTLNTVTDNNGYSAVSSFPAGTVGYGANAAFTHYYGDTLAGTNTAPAFNFKNANGNSTAGEIIPFTGLTSVAPSATSLGNVMGTLNFNGYATTGFTNDIGTQYQGGGVNALQSMQLQSYASESPSDSVLTLTSTNVTAVASSFRAPMGSPTVTGTKGQISFGSTTPSVGIAIRVTGTLTGTATGIVSGNTYYVIVTNGTTTATLSATPGGVPITTTAGTLTGLTLTRCGVTFTMTGNTSVPFGRGALVAVSGVTNITDGTYPVVGTPTKTSMLMGIPHTVAPSVSGAQSFSCRTAYMGSGFRIRSFPLATPANLQNRLEVLDMSPAATTVRTDSLTLSKGSYGNTGTALPGGDINYRRTFGCFHKVANVTAAAADTVYAFDWTTDTTAHVNTQGITVSNTSRINFDNAGDYNVVLEMVGKNTDAQDRTAYVWLAKNGTDLAETAIKLVLTKDTTTMLAKDWLVNGVADNDYVEVRFAVDTTTSGMSLEYTAAQTTPYVRPAVASATITITPVGA